MSLLNPIGYTYNVDISPGPYTIYDYNRIVYYGNADYFPGETSIQMDLSSILQHIINVPDLDKHFIQVKATTSETTHRIKLIDSANKTISGNFIWDYSCTDGSNIDYDRIFSDYPTPWVYTGQMVPISMYTPASNTYTILIRKKDSVRIITNFIIENLTQIDATTMSFFFNTSVDSDDYHMRMIANNNPYEDFVLDVKSCIPENTYTLYYVNLKGGLSYVHCTGKNTTKYTIGRNQFTKTPQYDKPYIHSTKSYMTSKFRTWTLNTPVLTDEQSKALMDLFVSPKVVLFDYSSKKYIAVNITDNSVEEKIRMNNHMFNYTINIQESQKYNIFQ